MDKKIIKKGFAEIRVRVSGIIQKQRFELRKEKSAYGEYYILCIGITLMAAEALRAANESGFPVRAANGVFFPLGTTPKNFLAGEE